MPHTFLEIRKQLRDAKIFFCSLDRRFDIEADMKAFDMIRIYRKHFKK